MRKIRVGILGATGMVGQRFVSLLEGHPWFEIVVVAASPESAGKTYGDAVQGRWSLPTPIPSEVQNLIVKKVEGDAESIARETELVFSALDLEKDRIISIETKYAASGVMVVSNNSAHRWTLEVPMIIPEVNPDHVALISIQRKKHGWGKGGIVVKPNCSIQSYVPVLSALWQFEPTRVEVTTAQAISGAGKTFATWPEMVDNVIPLIKGEEEKSEKEPLKVWGKVSSEGLTIAEFPKISATCLRVPVSDGHLASVAVAFGKKVTKAAVCAALMEYKNPIAELALPSAPQRFIHYFEEENFPQTKLHRDLEKGMAISVGRIREDPLFDFKFVALSHNTVRGAAGGAILTAELLVAKELL